MEIKTEVISDQKVRLILKGEIDFRNSNKISDKVDNLIKENYRKFVFDFAEVDSIDSSGVGKLLMLNKRLKSIEGGLVFF